MIILILVFISIHAGNSQPNSDAYSIVESDSCGLQIARPQDLQDAIQVRLKGGERIFGGVEMNPPGNWYPWTVRIGISFTNTINGQTVRQNPSCSGSILNHLWIVTAAHCTVYPEEVTYPMTGNEVYRQVEINNVVVEVGMVGRPKLMINKPTIQANPERIVTHEEYLEEGSILPKVYYDIALIKLEERLDFIAIAAADNRYLINSICLPRNAPNVDGAFHISAGFGNIGTAENNNKRLMAISRVRLAHFDHCYQNYIQFPGRFMYQQNGDVFWNTYDDTYNSPPLDQNRRNKYICYADMFPNEAHCGGDSGGPTMIQRSDGTQRFELTAINRGGNFAVNITFDNIIYQQTGHKNLTEVARLTRIYERLYPCGHQKDFINTYEFRDWIRDTIVNDPQSAGEDYTKFGVYTVTVAVFGMAGGARFIQRYKAKKEEKAKEEEVPPMTPSGV